MVMRVFCQMGQTKYFLEIALPIVRPYWTYIVGFDQVITWIIFSSYLQSELKFKSGHVY